MSNGFVEKLRPTHPPRPGARRAGARRSREDILRAAARLASTRGLSTLSLGELAEHLGMSKSGLFAHFDSKQELELATIEAAVDVFHAAVIAPVLAAPPGLARLNTLVESYLAHIQSAVFPGGCFFAAAAAELASQPGPTRTRIVEFVSAWLALIDQCIREAQTAGDINPKADPAQVTFELDAMLALGNMAFVLFGDAGALARARTGIQNVLAQHAAPAKRKR